METFNYLSRNYDIDAAKKLIADGKCEKCVVSVSVMAPHISAVSGCPGITVNTEYANGIGNDRIDEPGIFIVDETKGFPFHFLIDGWHRLYARYILGEEEMEVYVIDNPDDVKSIIL